MEQVDPVAVAGGAIIACPVERRTIHRFSLNAALVARAVERLLSHQHPVMILKDPVHAGYDYLMVVGEQRLALDPVTVWWLAHMNVAHRFAVLGRVRMSIRNTRCGWGCADCRERSQESRRTCARPSATRRCMHDFPAVVAPEHASRIPRGRSSHPGGLRQARRASGRRSGGWPRAGIPTNGFCAIGDEINDLPMIAQAGLGIAMGNAVPSIKAAARSGRRCSNRADGVAHAIGRVIAVRGSPRKATRRPG
jgi:hypothetical protein